MTEITDRSNEISPAAKRFILQWGDLGGQWGVNRSMGQIHALIYLAERPLTAEDVADTLGIARSNVSNSLKELVAWKLVRRVSVFGDRRDFYEAETDLWEMLFRIAEGRKEREIDPAIAGLRACVEVAKEDKALPNVSRKRLTDMLSFVENLDHWYAQMRALPRSKLEALVKLGTRVANALTLGRRKGSRER